MFRATLTVSGKRKRKHGSVKAATRPRLCSVIKHLDSQIGFSYAHANILDKMADAAITSARKRKLQLSLSLSTVGPRKKLISRSRK